MTSNLYLILHKVRGEAAFDIASKLEGPDDNHCAQEVWIIPTSGHRAHPMWQMELDKLDIVYEGGTINVIGDATCQWRPDQFPDHYAASEPRAAPAVRRVTPATATEDFVL